LWCFRHVTSSREQRCYSSISYGLGNTKRARILHANGTQRTRIWISSKRKYWIMQFKILYRWTCKMIPTKMYYIVFSEEFVCWGRSKILSPWSNVRHLSTFSLKTFLNIKLRSHGNEQNECFPLAYDRWSVVSLSKYKISEPKVTYWTIYTLFNFNNFAVYIVNTFMKIFFDIL